MTAIANNLLKKLFLKEKHIYILKIFCFIALLLIIINFSLTSSFVQDSELKISILYFNNHTELTDWDWLSKGLTDMLIDDLSRFDYITCPFRQDIEDLYLKHSLPTARTEMDKSLLIKINEDLNTEIIFFGNYFFSSSSELNLSLKKYEVTTGELITFRDIKAGKTDIFRLKESIVLLILEELDIELSSEDKALIKEAPTTSVDALINYYKCIDSRDKAIIEYQGSDYPSKKLWAEAIKYGERAVVLDLKYAEAYYLLAEIYNKTRWTIREVESLNKFIQLVENNQLESKRIYEKVAQAYFRLGYAFYSKKEFEQAIEYFNSSIAYSPDILESHLYLVQVYYDRGEIGLSLDECEEVLRIDPQNKQISWFIKKNEQVQKYGREAYENYEKGYLAYKKGNFEEAINYFRSSIFSNPEFKEPRYYLALSYYNLGDFDNSISQWQEAIRIDPFDNSAKHFLNKSLEEKEYGRETLRHFNAGYDYYIKGEYDKSIEEFNKSLNCNPKFEKARKYLSRSYYQLDQMDKYREEREKATELKTSDEGERAEEHYKLGYEFYSLNDFKVAIDELKKALNLKSDYPGARFLLGECYFQQKEYQLAQIEYDRVVTDSVKNEYTDDALLGSGWSYYLLGEYEQAAERFLKLIEEFSQSNLALQANYKLGKSYFKGKDYPKVIKAYKEFIEKYPQFQGPEIKEIYFLLGQAYLWLEQYREAEEVFSKLSSFYPEFELIKEAEYFRSLSLFKQEKYQEAIIKLEELVAEGEDKVKNEPYYLLARCWLNLEEYDKAIEKLEDLKQLKVEDSLLEKAVFDLGLAYSRYSDKERAVLEFQEFIEKYPQSELIKSAHFELGKNLYNLKKYKLALSELREISTAEALYLRGKAAEELGDQEGEIVAFEELREKFPQSEYSQEAYFKLGNYYYKQKKYKEGIEEFKKISLNFPHSSLISESYYWMGWSYFKLTEYQKASEYFKKVGEDDINLKLAQRAMFMAAESLYNLKDYQKAREEYRNFIGKYPKAELSVNVQYAIAWTFLENKEYELSIQEFKKLISIYPESKFVEEAQFRIGKGYFLLGNKDEAKTELEKFIDGYSKSESNFREEVLYLLSQMYLEEEKWMESITELERLVREYPDTKYLPDVLYGLCLSYFKKDEHNKAIEAGEKYLKDYFKLQFGDDILYIKAICWEKLENQEKAIADYQSLISKFPQSPYIEKAEERLEILHKESEQNN